MRKWKKGTHEIVKDKNLIILLDKAYKGYCEGIERMI